MNVTKIIIHRLLETGTYRTTTITANKPLPRNKSKLQSRRLDYAGSKFSQNILPHWRLRNHMEKVLSVVMAQ